MFAPHLIYTISPTVFFTFKGTTMTRLRLFEPSISNPLESVFRRAVAPWAFDNDVLDDVNVRIDVVEKDGMYKVRADLPGVKKEDINVRIDGNMVQIDAQTQDAKEFKEDGGKVLRSERYYGSLSRMFTLASDVDENKVVAKYSDGVLTLELPKKVAASSGEKRITIQ
jgi:HSP20 family protein